jgi:NTE family protein
VAQLYSPYVWGNSWHNPLDPIVRRMDFSKVCHPSGPKLHVGATSVRTGRIKLFTGRHVTPEAIMASACLPSVFQAIEIDGEAYWDGGYSGNPALFPLYEPELPDDVVIISLNPFERDGVPITPMDIQNRINEISFNAALLGELRAVNFVHRLLASGKIEKGQMKNVLVHLIDDEDLMDDLTATTKLLPSPALFERLKTAGRAACERFLTQHRDKLNHKSSYDLKALFG